MSHNCHIITFTNIKGGVGKTTAVVNLAYILGEELGYRVLVVDSDDQGNATKSLGARGVEGCEGKNLWQALENKLHYKKVAVPTPYENIMVVPSTKELKSAQLAFGQSARGLKMFHRMLRSVESSFDFVLIDTKPQINILLQAALVASDWYIVPSFPESDSYDGFIDLIAECEEIYEEQNEGLNCLGLLFTNVKRSPAHDTYVDFMTKHLKKAKIPIFKTHIRHSNAIATGSLHQCPAVSLGSSRHISDDYRDVAKQLLRFVNAKSLRARPDMSVLGLVPADEEESGFVIAEDTTNSIQI